MAKKQGKKRSQQYVNKLSKTTIQSNKLSKNNSQTNLNHNNSSSSLKKNNEETIKQTEEEIKKGLRAGTIAFKVAPLKYLDGDWYKRRVFDVINYLNGIAKPQ